MPIVGHVDYILNWFKKYHGVSQHIDRLVQERRYSNSCTNPSKCNIPVYTNIILHCLSLPLWFWGFSNACIRDNQRGDLIIAILIQVLVTKFSNTYLINHMAVWHHRRCNVHLPWGRDHSQFHGLTAQLWQFPLFQIRHCALGPTNSLKVTKQYFTVCTKSWDAVFKLDWLRNESSRVHQHFDRVDVSIFSKVHESVSLKFAGV